MGLQPVQMPAGWWQVFQSPLLVNINLDRMTLMEYKLLSSSLSLRDNSQRLLYYGEWSVSGQVQWTGTPSHHCQLHDSGITMRR